jgi:hypothetical protein
VISNELIKVVDITGLFCGKKEETYGNHKNLIGYTWKNNGLLRNFPPTNPKCRYFSLKA